MPHEDHKKTQTATPFDREAVREEIAKAMLCSQFPDPKEAEEEWAVTDAGPYVDCDECRRAADAILPIIDRLLAESEKRVRSCEAFLTMKKADHEAALTEIAKIMNGTAHEADLQEMESLRLTLREWLSKAGGEFAKLKASLATARADNARLKEAVEAFMPSAEVAFLWSKETPPADEVQRYRERYWAVKEALSPADAKGGEPSGGSPVQIDYTNHRGERAMRLISPRSVAWGSNKWHPEPQWLLTAWDQEKGAERVFALRDIHSWGEPTNPRPVVPEELVARARASAIDLEQCSLFAADVSPLIAKSMRDASAVLRTLIQGGDNGR